MIKKIKNNAFAKNSAILFAGSMVANVLNYIFHVVVGRMVDAQVYGEVESLVALMNIISVPAMTLTMVATKYSAQCKSVNDKRGTREIMSYMNRRIIKYGIPILIVTFFASPYVGRFLNIDNAVPLILIWISMFFAFLLSVNSGILNGWQKFKETSISGIWGVLIKLIFVIFFIKIGFQINGIIGSFLLGSVASYIASIVMLKFISKEENSGTSDECETNIDFTLIKKYLIPVFVGNLAINIIGNVDMIMAKHNLDPNLAGQYGALTIVSKIIFFATGVIGSVLFSMSSADHHKNNNSLKILKQASYLMVFACVVATILYFMVPGLIMSILFGNKYDNVLVYLGFFAIMASLFSFVNMFFSYFLSISKALISYILFALSIILILTLLFFGKSIYAIILIMTALLVVSVIVSLFLFHYYREKLIVK